MKKWDELGNREELINGEVQKQYEQIFSAMPTPTYITYGNVDRPEFWPNFKRRNDCSRWASGSNWWIEIWFCWGGLKTPYRTPYEITDEEFQKNVDALGPVDVLCSHIPPAIADITFDVIARRFERGSIALLEYIKKYQPKYSLFGHVHQPLASRTRVGKTECINVGHFRATKRPFVLDL